MLLILPEFNFNLLFLYWIGKMFSETIEFLVFYISFIEVKKYLANHMKKKCTNSHEKVQLKTNDL